MDGPHLPPPGPGRPPPPRPPWEAGPGAAGVSPAPPASTTGRPARRRGSWLAGVLVLAVLAGLGGVGAFGLRSGELPRTTASTYVPPDAHHDTALFTQGGRQSRATVEHARVRGPYLRWAVSPVMFKYTAWPPGLDRRERGGVHWWREATLPAADQPPRYRVFSVNEDGIRMHGQDWGALALTLEPAPVWLPADAHAGQEWVSSGIGTGAGLDGLWNYRASMRADAAARGCLQVTSTTELTPQDPGASANATRWTERDLWCPGRGIVESSGSLGTAAYSVSTEDGTPPEPLPDNAVERTVDATGIDGWRHGTLDAFEGDETFGTVAMEAPVDKMPVETAGGNIVFGPFGTTDLAGLLPVEDGGYWLHWWARPGGQIVSLADFGRTVVATTTDRTMAAYAPGGGLLWSVTLDDVSAGPPVRVSDDLLVVASTNGAVSLRNAVDGREVWSHRVPYGVAHQPATDGSVVAALDTRDGLHVLDARTGEERWKTEVAVGTELVAVGGGTTLIAGARLEAYDNRTGELRWHRTVTSPEDVQVHGGTVAVETPAGVEWFGLDDGSTLGTFPGASEPRPVGGSWFVLAGDSLVAVRSDGTRSRSWRLSVPAERRQVVVGSTRVWVFGTDAARSTLTGEWVGPGG